MIYNQLEAIACGTPVIVSNTSSIPEICKDAAHRVEALSNDGISAEMYGVIDASELRNDLIKRGFDFARTFEWDVPAWTHLALSEVLDK